jgi:hypothetical protein
MAFLFVLIVGIGIGWLVGLSETPVVAGAIAVTMAASAALVGSLGKYPQKSAVLTNGGARMSELLDPLPLAALVIGISVGAPIGLYARTSGWFLPAAAPATSPDLEAIVSRWEKLGLDRNEVAKRLLDRELPIRTTDRSHGEGEHARIVPSGLVVGSDDECAGFRAAAKDRVLFELRGSHRPHVRKLANSLPDTRAELALLLLEVACPQKP